MTRTSSRVKRIGFSVVIAVGLIGVFYLYSRPDFLVLLANQVWACF